jgi:hypothetical protein
MSSPRKKTISSASTKNTAIPNVSMWESSEPKGLKVYTFGEGVQQLWPESIATDRPGSTTDIILNTMSDRSLKRSKPTVPRIVASKQPFESRIFLKKGFRTQRNREDGEQSSSLFGDKIYANSLIQEASNPYYLPKLKIDRVVTGVEIEPRLSFGQQVPETETSSPSRTENYSIRFHEGSAASVLKHRPTISEALPEQSNLGTNSTLNPIKIRDPAQKLVSQVTFNADKLRNLRSLSSLQDDGSREGSLSNKTDKTGFNRDKPSKIFKHLDRVKCEASIFEEKMIQNFRKAEDSRLKQVKETFLKQKYGNNLADFKKDCEALFTELANPTSSKLYGKNLEQVESFSSKMVRSHRPIALSHRMKLLPGINPLEISKDKASESKSPNVLVGILSQSTKTRPTNFGLAAAAENSLYLPELVTPSLPDSINPYQLVQQTPQNPQIPPSPFLRAFSQIATHALSNAALSQPKPNTTLVSPQNLHQRQTLSINNRTSILPVERVSASLSRHLPSIRDGKKESRRMTLYGAANASSRECGTILSTTELGERSSRGKKSSAFARKGKQMTRGREASKMLREDSHHSQHSVHRPSQMLKKKHRTEKEELDLMVSDIKFQLALLIKLEGVPDKYELLRHITRDNPACEILEIYLEAPEQLERFPVSILQLDPERPKNLRLIISDLKEFFLETKQLALEQETAQVRVYNELADLSRTKIKQKLIELSYLRPDLKDHPRLKDLRKICEIDYLQLYQQTRVKPITDRLEALEKEMHLDYLSDYSREISKLTHNITGKMSNPISNTERDMEVNPMGLGHGMLERLREATIAPDGAKIDIPPLLDIASLGIPEFPERTNDPLMAKEFEVDI